MFFFYFRIPYEQQTSGQENKQKFNSLMSHGQQNTLLISLLEKLMNGEIQDSQQPQQQTFNERQIPQSQIVRLAMMYPRQHLLNNNKQVLENGEPLAIPNSSSQMKQNFYKKRKELEQDLDNGDTADFLRLPY